MAFQNPYPYLPGHLVEFKDGGFAALKPETNPPKTESVLILGTAADGPVLTPVAVDPSTANIFGKSKDALGVPNGASLLRGFEEAYQAGCRDIRLMRISGSGAKLAIEGSPIVQHTATPSEEIIGQTIGNAAATFVLGHAPFVGVQEVRADADILAASAYELNKAGVATAPAYTYDGPNDGVAPVAYTNLAIPVGVNLDTQFIVSTIANASADEDVNIKITLADPAKASDLTLSYFDDVAGDFAELSFDASGVAVFGDATTGFKLADAELPFKVLFNKAGAVTFTLEVIKLSDSSVLASREETVNAHATVTVLKDVAKANSLVTIKYDVDPVGNGDSNDYITYTENYTESADGTVADWIAPAYDKDFDLGQTPMPGTLRITIAGALLSPVYYTIDAAAKKVNIKPEARLDPGQDITVAYSYDVVSSVTPELVLETPWGGQVYNETCAWVENVVNASNQVIGKKLIIQVPPAKSGPNTKPLEYSSVQYPTFNAMAQAINTDLDIGRGIVKARCKKSFDNLLTKELAAKARSYFSGGDDGLNLTKQEIFEALGGKKDPITGEYISLGAYQLLENYKADYLAVMDIAADDELPNPNDNFAHQMAMACFVISYRSRVIHGVIPTTSPEDTGLMDILNHTKHLLANCPNNYFLKDTAGNVIYDEEGKALDLGKYITVLAGPDVIFRHQTLGQYTVNSPCIYAGMVSNMPVSSSPLNKAVPGIRGLRFTYGNPQLNSLTGARFVTLNTDDNGSRNIVTDAMTAAQGSSDYAQLVNWRSVKKSVDEVRAACKPYIGEPPSVTNQNAMGSAIDKRIEQMKTLGDVQDCKFEIIASVLDRVLGRSKIKLTVTPPGTLRQITTVVEVAPM